MIGRLGFSPLIGRLGFSAMFSSVRRLVPLPAAFLRQMPGCSDVSVASMMLRLAAAGGGITTPVTGPLPLWAAAALSPSANK
jgi:hypothetical protein